MINALSSSRNRALTLIILLISGGLTISAATLGVDDNPPGILMALLAAAAFVLAFAHPWRTARKFLLLLLASVLGFVLFIILNIITDMIVQNPLTASALKRLVQSPAFDTLNLTIVMVLPAAFIVGAAGAITLAVRSCRSEN